MSEATTIDRLSIEITSNSTDAAQGIDALAVSLGKLKQNGSVSVAVKNLNNLSDALRKLTPVTSNANKLSALADSITKLSGAGSISKVVNQLNKLPGVLKGLSSLNVDNGLGEKLERLAQATVPLSNIKTGGLGTMVNALAKIGKVTDSLDDDTISRFADRIEKLNEKLTPLSSKMTTIQAGLRGINSSAKSAATGVSAFDGKVKTARLNLASLVTVVQGAISVLMPLVRLLSDTISQAIEWDGVAARFGRGFGDRADEVYSWIQRLNQEMGINVQQFMQYSSVFATMLQGFGVGTEDSAKMALGYTELIYDIWAGYNDVYKNFGDAADAVKSAIAGEVEPIRRAGFTIVESTLEQTAANHGLEISLENATEAQKSYLRYLTLVDQAHAQNLVGTYARELNTAEGLMRTFSQQLKSLAQAFGSLFLPILVKVMPWLQAFIDLLTEAIILIASFFGITIQPISWGGFGGGTDMGVSGLESVSDAADSTTSALGNTADAVDDTTEALKDLKKATIGIDELNVISPPEKNNSSGSGGSGGGGGGAGGGGGGGSFPGLDVDSLWDESIFDQIQSQVDEIKEKLREWLPVIGTIGGALAGLGIATLLKNLGDALEKMNLLQRLFATVAIVAIEAALVFKFADDYLETGNLLYLVGEALVTAAAGYLLFRAWGPAGALLGLSVSIIAQLAALEMSLADGTVSLSSPETWIQGITTTLMGAFGGAIISKNTGFFAKEGFVIGLGVTASLTLAAIRMGAIESGEIKSDSVEAWILEIGSVISAGLAGKWLGSALYTGGGPMGALIGVTAGLVLNLVGTITVKGEDFGNEISDWINAAITTAMTGFTATKIWKLISPTIVPAVKGLIPKIGGAISTALGGLGSAVTAVGGGWAAAAIAAIVAVLALAIVDYDFTEIGRKIGEAIGKACRVVVDFASDIGGAIWDGLCAAFDWCKENITWDNIKSFLGAVFDKETWTEIIWPKVKEIGLEVWNGLWDGIKEGAKNLWGNITEFVNGFIQGFKDGFEIHSPSKKMIALGKELLAGLVQPLTPSVLRDKIRDMWNTAKSWWSSKSGLEKINIAVSLVKKGWSTVKGWIGSIPGVSQSVSLVKKGWTSISRWIGTISTLSQKIGLKKSGWSSVKKWIGNLPKLSQAVSLAKSGWRSVKGWVGSIPTMSIGMKLVKSGWTTIKKWLGNLTYKIGFKLPRIGVNWSSREVLGFKITFPSGFYTYAKGGFPDFGELFIANEAGPEMVGKIGSKTTVANNDQIVEGISEGVYAAVLAAMKSSEGNGSPAFNVYLDGRQITAVVEKRQHERGATIMNNRVFSY